MNCIEEIREALASVMNDNTCPIHIAAEIEQIIDAIPLCHANEDDADDNRVVMYKCRYCGKLFDSKDICNTHEKRHEDINKANEMLRNGCTLEEINKVCNIWYDVPEHLKNVTKDNCFIIKHWQCCERPAYRIKSFNMDGELYLQGCGSWTGYYGGYMNISSYNLNNPRPSEEYFVDKRYEK